MLTRHLFGLRVHFWRRRGAWWWRVWCWPRRYRSVGIYRTRAEAIKHAAQLLCDQVLKARGS